MRAIELNGLQVENNKTALGLATEIARIPELIRGYGHVKARQLASARPKWDALMEEWRAGPLRLAKAAVDPRLAADTGPLSTHGPDTVPFALDEQTASRLPV